MKKAVLFMLAAMAIGGAAQAQYYYYNTAPWDGNKSYILNVGTDFSITPRSFGANTLDVKSTPGLAASLRYEGDKNINERLSWGYQVEASYLAQGYKYEQASTTWQNSIEVPIIKHADLTWWDAQLDMRLSFAYWFGDNIEVQAAAGIYYGILYGIKGVTYETYGTTDVEVPESRNPNAGGMSFFGFDMGVSTLVQCKYFFNENFFVNLTLRDNIGLNLFGEDFEREFGSNGGQRGIVTVGVGYKFIK